MSPLIFRARPAGIIMDQTIYVLGHLGHIICALFTAYIASRIQGIEKYILLIFCMTSSCYTLLILASALSTLALCVFNSQAVYGIILSTDGVTHTHRQRRVKIHWQDIKNYCTEDYPLGIANLHLTTHTSLMPPNHPQDLTMTNHKSEHPEEAYIALPFYLFSPQQKRIMQNILDHKLNQRRHTKTSVDSRGDRNMHWPIDRQAQGITLENPRGFYCITR